MVNIGGILIETPLALAPMAGVTDASFRAICREQGAGLTCTEMVSAKALCFQDKKSVPLLKLGEGERPAAAQIFGSDPVCMEEAAAIAQLIQRWGLSQEEAARKLGKSQSAVANKLRLLRLPPSVVELLGQGDLSERHARALLRLADEEEQIAAAKTIIQRHMNVAQAEEYIESLLREIQATPPRRRPTFILKDVRLFLNSLDRSLTLMRSAGVEAGCSRQDTEDEILLTIRIPKGRRVG